MRALLVAGLCLTLACGACAPRPLGAPKVGGTASALTPSPTPVESGQSANARRRALRTPRPIATVAAVATRAPAAPSNAAEAPSARVSTVSLDGLLDGVLPDPSADYGLVLEDLGSGARTALNESQSFPSASLYKLGVAWLVLRHVDAGGLSLDAPLAIEDDDAIEPEPDGGFGVGDAPTVREALAGMMSVSSNAAAHAFLRTLGRAALAAEMDRIGLSETRVPDAGPAVTSAADMAHLLRLIVTSSDLSAASRELLTQAMSNIAPPDALRDTLPDAVDIFDKTGNLEDASNVSALLETPRGAAILVVVDTGVDPGDARGVIAQAGQVAYRALLE